MPCKRLLYLGHEYHLKTKSSNFMIELLKEKYEVDFITYDPYVDSFVIPDNVVNQYYDFLVCWQIMPERQWIKENFLFKQGILFPMFDFVVSISGIKSFDDIWKDFFDFKIINFSYKLHIDLKRKGYNSYYIKYFPKPQPIDDWGKDDSLFFWQRMENININTVEAIFKGYELNHIFLHKALDPKQKFITPLENIQDKIIYSEWFENKDELLKIMEKSAFYMAPRMFEGIGMSFLEAMAMGRCVVAPDEATMNEYIENGVNGYLYNWRKPEKIRFENIRKIQKQAYDYINQGYAKWKNEKYRIIEWMEEDEHEPLVTIVTISLNILRNGRQNIFRKCVESVHSQIYKNIQHLVIDGASDDGTLDILEEYKSLNWIEYVSEKDSNMYEAMNKGIRMAKGKYVVFLNTDDFFHDREAIKISVGFLENSGADFSFADNWLIDKKGNRMIMRKSQIGSFVAQMPFCHQTMFSRKSILESVGGFDENYKSAADYDLVIRLLLKRAKYVYVPFNIVSFSMQGVSVVNQINSDKEKKQIFRRIYGSINSKYNNQKFSKELAGRICPNELFEDLKEIVDSELWIEMQKAVVNVRPDGKYDIALDVNLETQYYSDDKKILELKDQIESQNQIILQKNERIDKFINYFRLLNTWMELKEKGQNLSEYILKKGFNEIAIYGAGEIGKHLYEELKDSSVLIAYCIEKKLNKSFYNKKVYLLSEDLPKCDAVIVTPTFAFQEIQKELKNKVKMPIISIDEIVFGMYEG